MTISTVKQNTAINNIRKYIALTKDFNNSDHEVLKELIYIFHHGMIEKKYIIKADLAKKTGLNIGKIKRSFNRIIKTNILIEKEPKYYVLNCEVLTGIKKREVKKCRTE